MRGLGTSPFQSSLPPIFPSISLPQPLGSEAFKILFHVCLGLPFIPVGPDRDFGRVQRTVMRLSCPEPQDMDGWAHFFLISPPTHNSCSGLFFILPYLTFTKGHALWFALISSSASSFLPGSIPSPQTLSRAGQCYWCFFNLGPSSIFVFDMSPLSDTSFSPSLDPRA